MKCLENQYDKRPTFTMLKGFIEKKKREQRSKFKDYKSSLITFLQSKIKVEDKSEEEEEEEELQVEQMRTVNPQTFGISNNMEFSMYKSQQFKIEKKKVEKENLLLSNPVDDIFEPSKPPVESIVFPPEEKKNLNEMKKSRYKIFDDSQDLYYRKIEKRDQIQEVDLGKHFIGKGSNPYDSESSNAKKQKKYIKISEV
jgi:hypothetical protein